jgi:hypothetical protein
MGSRGATKHGEGRHARPHRASNGSTSNCLRRSNSRANAGLS